MDADASRRPRRTHPNGRTRRTRRELLAAVGTAGLAGLAGCGRLAERDLAVEYELNHTAAEWSRYDSEWERSHESPRTSPLDTSVTPEVLVENLEIPWDLAFAPNGELFVTERTGRIRRFDGDGLETVAAPGAVIDAELEVEAGESLDDRISLSVRPQGFRGGGVMERARIETDSWIPLQSIARSFSGLTDESARIAYLQSVVTVGYLESRTTLEQRRTLLERLGEGLSADQALHEVLGLDTAGLDRAVREEILAEFPEWVKPASPQPAAVEAEAEALSSGTSLPID